MNLAIYSRASRSDVPALRDFVQKMRKQNDHVIFIHEQIAKKPHKVFQDLPTFSDHEGLLAHKPDFLLTFGGDGTVLDTLMLVKDANLPIIGCNTGRLGFLSNIQPNALESLIARLSDGAYKVTSRTVLELNSNHSGFSGTQYALNDISIHKRDTSAMISVDTYLDDNFFNTYWADGLLIATPTGSTAYSLSCGGPVVFPETSGLIINPVAAHNLNVRPVVINNQTTITLKVGGRGTNFLLALDSRYEKAQYNTELVIKTAPFSLKFIELTNRQFIDTLREKLHWGNDLRNK